MTFKATKNDQDLFKPRRAVAVAKSFDLASLKTRNNKESYYGSSSVMSNNKMSQTHNSAAVGSRFAMGGNLATLRVGN